MATTKWKENLREQFPTILVEVVSVVFAVLLALAVNAWQERRAEDHLAQEAWQRIEAEIRLNRDELATSLPEQRATLEEFRQTVARYETEPGDSVRIELTTGSLRDAAWQTALVTQAVRFMDFEKVSDLSAIYNLQGMVDEAVDRVLSTMTAVELFDDAQRLAGFKSLRNTYAQLLDLESQLLEIYDEFLAEYSSNA